MADSDSINICGLDISRHLALYHREIKMLWYRIKNSVMVFEHFPHQPILCTTAWHLAILTTHSFPCSFTIRKMDETRILNLGGIYPNKNASEWIFAYKSWGNSSLMAPFQICFFSWSCHTAHQVNGLLLESSLQSSVEMLPDIQITKMWMVFIHLRIDEDELMILHNVITHHTVEDNWCFVYLV